MQNSTSFGKRGFAPAQENVVSLVKRLVYLGIGVWFKRLNDFFSGRVNRLNAHIKIFSLFYSEIPGQSTNVSGVGSLMTFFLITILHDALQVQGDRDLQTICSCKDNVIKINMTW